MKLLSQTSAQSSARIENEQLIDSNIRLRKFYNEIVAKIKRAKTDYSPEKAKAMDDFELFIKDINQKKHELLQELSAIQKEIEKSKDIYYGLVAKQDALDEKIYQLAQAEKKLDTRQAFVEQLESNFNKKAYGG